MSLPKAAVALVVALAISAVAWPHLDQTASRIVLPFTFVAIALTWYSILSLREKRGENWWHTADRLLRATFVAVTLVFVVEIATRPGPEVGTTVVYEKIQVNFADELNALDKTWSIDTVSPVIERHFAKLGRVSETTLRPAGGDNTVKFRAGGGVVTDLKIQ